MKHSGAFFIFIFFCICLTKVASVVLIPGLSSNVVSSVSTRDGDPENVRQENAAQ